MKLLSYGCSSAAGMGVNPFWRSLQEGRHHTRPALVKKWPVIPSPIPNLCAWNEETRQNGAQDTLVSHLIWAWQEACETFEKSRIAESLGVIFASTKGALEDFIWKSPEKMGQDPLTPVMDAFIQRAGLKPKKNLCVSNACASSHGALFLAKKWLEAGSVSHVLVIAADLIGPFVVNGFQSLQALSKKILRPFSEDRDGLVLGDGAAALLLSVTSDDPSLEIEEIAIDNEGYSITRPSQGGESLRRIYEKISLTEKIPDFVIAHGTGTIENDRTEDCVLSETFKKGSNPPPVTATKWCIGHTLGASGAMDLIAAAESLRHQKIFSIGNTTEADKNFRMPYLCRGQEWKMAGPLRRVLVNSLGFGGAHAALLLHSGRA